MQTVANPMIFEVLPSTWEHAKMSGEIVIGPTWTGDWKQAALAAGVETHNTTSWVVRIEQVAPRHTAIQVGDYVCRQSEKKPIFVVRLSEPTIP